MCEKCKRINIKNPAAVLNLAHLNARPPQTRLDVEEAMDTILLHWSEDLADDDSERMQVSAQIAALVYPYLEAC